jgi:raffinose/stachyose/melibiose transport system permease protein
MSPSLDPTTIGPARGSVPPPRGRRRQLSRGVGTALLTIVSVVFVLPFLYTVSTALRPAADFIRSPLGLPRHLTLSNFIETFKQIHYAASVANTLVIMALSCVFITVIGALAAYPLGRITSNWSTAVYRLFILGTSVPIFVIIAPLYLLMRDLNLLDTRLGVILIYTAVNLPVSLFFYTSFVRQIPADLEEAAAMDGCGPLRTFFTVVFPLLRPVTGTLLTFISLQIWNDLIIPLVFLQDPDKRTVMVNAYAFVNPHTIQPTQLFPAALLGVLPLFVLFMLFQRQVVEGIAAGAVKS